MGEYKIKITYFKASGKYYSDGSYTTKLLNMFEVFDEFEAMLKRGERPGLIGGHAGYHAVLNCDAHPNGYPAMFVGKA